MPVILFTPRPLAGEGAGVRVLLLFATPSCALMFRVAPPLFSRAKDERGGEIYHYSLQPINRPVEAHRAGAGLMYYLYSEISTTTKRSG